MAVAALIVAIVGVLAGAGSFWYARQLDGRAKQAVAAAQESAAAAQRSATAAEARVAVEDQRRQGEMTPQFRVSFDWADNRLKVLLKGPAQLERLDSLTVRIRDDRPRQDDRRMAGGPTAEQVAAQVWGPFRFIPGTGPGASPGSDVGAADATGRVTPTAGMPVGESLVFALEPTTPPGWSAWSVEDWRSRVGMLLRLQLEARREGWEPWSLPCELDTSAGAPDVEVP
jgi:hypothetical protein